MTITSTTSRWEYTGNGSTTTFAYNNKIFSDTDLDVYVDGTLKTLTTDYTVTGAGTAGGGNVVFGTAPADGTAVTIVRDVANTQEIDFPLGGPFPSDSIEDAVDRRTIIAQQLKEVSDRALRFKSTDQSLPSAELPTLSSLKGKFLRFNSTTGVPEAVLADPADPENMTYSGAAAPGPGTTTVDGALDFYGRRLREMPSIVDFGATAGADSQTAIASALTYGNATSKILFAPEGAFTSTANFTNLHAVRWLGPGRIVRGSDTFHVDPRKGDENTIYFNGGTGSSSNDGLTSSQPLDTFQNAYDAVVAKRSLAVGTWIFSDTANSVTIKFDEGRLVSPTKFLIPTHFATHQALIDWLVPIWHPDGDDIEAEMETGYTISAGLHIQNVDFSRLKLSSVDATVSLAVGFTGITPSSDPFEDNSLWVIDGPSAKAWIDCLVDMGNPTDGSGLVITNGGHVRITTAGMGVTKAGLFGLYINKQSSMVAPQCRFDAANAGSRVTTNSQLEAPNCDFSGALNASYGGVATVANLDISRGSMVYVTGSPGSESDFTGGAGEGLGIRRSFVSATSVNTSSNGINGVNLGAGSTCAFNASISNNNTSSGVVCAGGNLDMASGTATGNGNHGLFANAGGRINGHLGTFSGNTNAGAIASSGSHINVQGANCQSGGAPAATDIQVGNGSIINAVSATGGLSRTANTIGAGGIIFQ